MPTRITRLFIMLSVSLSVPLWLAACGLKDDYRMTLECKGQNELLSKQAHKPAKTETREEGRRYAFQMRGLDGYSCHTWRKEKIGCLRAMEDELAYVHESIILQRGMMKMTHTVTTEDKKSGLVTESSFDGQCTRSES